MRLASFSYQGKDRIGAAIDDRHMIDLVATAAVAGAGASAFATDMMSLIDSGAQGFDAATTLVEFARRRPERVKPIAFEDITWYPPVRKPGKIIGVAINNSAADVRKISAPDHPLIFLKPPTSLLGHLQPIEVRPYYRRLHPEPELALVIGKRGKDINPRNADEFVFGYTIMNDITGNDMRAEDRVHYYALYAKKDDPDQVEKVEQHLSYAARYKGSDGFGPMGPWIVMRDEVKDPTNLDVKCTIGGELLTEDNTRYYTYNYAEVIAWVSRFMTLEPGDVISLGTAFREAKPGERPSRPLHTGDLSRLDGPVEVTISGIGANERCRACFARPCAMAAETLIASVQR